MRGREPLAVWLLFAVVALEILVTYARVPAEELYHVTGSGLVGGVSRVIVFLNFPAALVAIAIVAVSYPHLTRRGRAVALAAAALCTPVFWPGVVSQAHLDARWVNAIAAFGVFLALVVTATTKRTPTDPRGDRARIVLAVLALAASPAWLAAELGFFFPGPHVHHGHHHGMDGVLLVLTALLLSRQRSAQRPLIVAYLALMLVYGFGNIANDFWLEQIVRRGWTGWEVPSVLEPRPTWAWLVVVAATAAIWLGWWLRRPRSPAAGRTRQPSRARS
jgi:hypothetical protein